MDQYGFIGVGGLSVAAGGPLVFDPVSPLDGQDRQTDCCRSAWSAADGWIRSTFVLSAYGFSSMGLSYCS